MTYESLSKIGKLGININGDFEDEILIEKALKAEKHVNVVWIGDSDFFKDPFYVAKLLIENTDLTIGFGILRAKHCHRILKELENFSDNDRIIVGVSAGDGGKIENAMRCILKIKEKYRFPVVAGGTGKKALTELSRISDGFLLNHISPKHVDYALQYVHSEFVSAYGPCLILPSQFEQDLLLATAMIMGSSRNFIDEMGYTRIFEEIKKIDIFGLIAERQKGKDLNGFKEFAKLTNYREFLFEKFSIAGNIDEVSEKIALLLQKCNHVILSDPFFREKDFDERLKKIIENLKKKI